MAINSFHELVDEVYLNEVVDPKDRYTLLQHILGKINGMQRDGKFPTLENFIDKSVGISNPQIGPYYYMESDSTKLSHLGEFYSLRSDFHKDSSSKSQGLLLLAASELYADKVFSAIAYKDTSFIDEHLSLVISYISYLLNLSTQVTEYLLEEIARIKLKFKSYSIFSKKAKYVELETIRDGTTDTQIINDINQSIRNLKSLNPNSENENIMLLLIEVAVDSFVKLQLD